MALNDHSEMAFVTGNIRMSWNEHKDCHLTVQIKFPKLTWGKKTRGGPDGFMGLGPKTRGGRGPSCPPCCAPPDFDYPSYPYMLIWLQIQFLPLKLSDIHLNSLFLKHSNFQPRHFHFLNSHTGIYGGFQDFKSNMRSHLSGYPILRISKRSTKQ